MAARFTDRVPDELARRLRYLPEATPEEQQLFLADAKRFVAGLDRKVLRTAGPITRTKWQLAADGRLSELLAVLAHDREHPATIKVQGLRTARLSLPGLDSSVLPDDIATLNRKDIPVRSRITELDWADGKLRVRGYAYVANVPFEKGGLRMAALRRRGSKRVVPLRIRSFVEPAATAESKQSMHNFDGSGFELSVNPRQLRRRGGWQSSKWDLGMIIAGPGNLYAGRLAKGNLGSAVDGLVRRLDDGVRLVATFPKNRLQLTVDVVPAEVTGHSVDNGILTLVVRARPDSEPKTLRIEQPVKDAPPAFSMEFPLERRSGGQGWIQYEARVPLDKLPTAQDALGATADLHTMIRFADGKERRATVAETMTARAYPHGTDEEIAVDTDAVGVFRLRAQARRPVVDRVEWNAAGELTVEGSYSGPGDRMRLLLRHTGRHEDRALDMSFADGRFTACFTPDAVSTYEGEVPLRAGRWHFNFRAVEEWDHVRDIPVTLRQDLVETLPKRWQGGRRTYTVGRSSFDRFFLESGSVLGPDETGGYRQRKLREKFHTQQRELPIKEAVLYASFGGKQFSDSPRAVYEELVRRGVEVEHIWTVSDEQAVVPEGVTTVEWASKEWYEALATSRYLVFNHGIRDWFQRREGQVVVQTWHGTPLKKIGADLLGTPKANLAYIASLNDRFSQYSFLVSPNAFTTPIMKNAFRATCEILESGYPRNDMFHSADKEERAALVRARLGIPEGKKIVLYAPTWRDDQRYGGRRFKLDNQVDLGAAQRVLGDDHVFLYRKHPKVLDSIPGAGQGFVHDVTSYPDIAELYLIADVLITDYSSVFFDFAHSGKPMLFFTYDLEHYRDELRGLYFDLGERAPGPLIKTSDELIAAIRDIDEVSRTYQERYEQFARDFCEPSDGHAAERVVDRMLELSAGHVLPAPSAEAQPVR
ncbi:CDP-glycerol glycerophosphotransferase family protein [Streptomyces sp. TRM66268-LWL]|uniref:CDP-glycerol glycerophosphotransferase family protein n=1 Tax=Streptomyces polyasparticus TaxID=2767826 RepID=A0ABR7SPH3_9ACTN|nr:CDP-glycerol glycerophosphotransferase family protein [Streptomyces polyasparticus]MBC9716218.1 CDP-glycerol glycerophosphotransferase family protein [Streptomyces polyasparticus]